MIRINFGLHYSEPFENETKALEEMAEFIVEQYEDLAYQENILDPNEFNLKEMFNELGWEFEEIK